MQLTACRIDLPPENQIGKIDRRRTAPVNVNEDVRRSPLMVK